MIKDRNSNETRRAWCKNLTWKIAHIISLALPCRLLVNAQEKFCKIDNYKESEYVICYLDPYKKVMKKEWFQNHILKSFEDAEFFVPEGYDDILKTIYKRYKELSDYDDRNAFDVEKYLSKDLKLGQDETFEMIEMKGTA